MFTDYRVRWFAIICSGEIFMESFVDGYLGAMVHYAVLHHRVKPSTTTLDIDQHNYERVLLLCQKVHRPGYGYREGSALYRLINNETLTRWEFEQSELRALALTLPKVILTHV